MKKNIVGVVQVRMNSSRVPGKALLELHGKPVIQWVLDSIRGSSTLDCIIVATTNSESDDFLCEYLNGKVAVYRGDSFNVAERLYSAGLKVGATDIVRITGDHPLTCSSVIDYLVSKHIQLNNDYTSFERDNIAQGVRSEILSMRSLQKIVKGQGLEVSEYLTFFYTKNAHYFKLSLLEVPEIFCFRGLRLMLDYIEDLDYLKLLINCLEKYGLEITYTSIIELFKGELPEILKRDNPLNSYEINYKSILDKIPQYD